LPPLTLSRLHTPRGSYFGVSITVVPLVLGRVGSGGGAYTLRAMSARFQMSALFAAWLAAAVALLAAAAEPATAVTDPCVQPSETLCPLEPQQPLDKVEHEVERDDAERAKAEQAPPRPLQPVPRMVNTSMMANDAWQEQQNRDALFTMEIARKNLRNAALFHVLSRPPAA
jgi:hypothetical protein